VVKRKSKKFKGFKLVEATDMYRKVKLITIGFNGFTHGGWMTDTPINRELLIKVMKKKEKGALL
jgi:hypothetical protein